MSDWIVAIGNDADGKAVCLIGINMVDLSRLTGVKRGRVEYKRAKTGRHLSHG